MMLRVSSPLCGSRIDYALDAVFNYEVNLLKEGADYSAQRKKVYKCEE